MYSKKELSTLDDNSNLHIVCRNCNKLKSDLDDSGYKKLRLFLDSNPDIKDNIETRLKRGVVVFSNMANWKGK